MSGIGGWLGGGAALIVIGLCFILMRFGHHLPQFSQPWQHRLVIILMYSAGAALVFTPVGAWVLHTLETLGGYFGGSAPGSGGMWALVTIGGLFLFAGLVVALVWEPNPGVAYVAMLTPLVLALTAGGFVHHIYEVTTYPSQALVSQIGHWAGG